MKCQFCGSEDTKGYPEYNHYVYGCCGAVTLDSGRDWGIAKNKSFENLDVAKFYLANGILPEKLK